MEYQIEAMVLLHNVSTVFTVHVTVYVWCHLAKRCKHQRFANRLVATFVNIHGVVQTLCARNLGEIVVVSICCNVSIGNLGRLHAGRDAVF